MFGLEIGRDGIVVQRTQYADGLLRSRRLHVPEQRVYFSTVGEPKSWEPMKQATIRTMNDPALS